MQLCHHLALHICGGLLHVNNHTFSSKICKCVHVEYHIQLNALNVSDVKPLHYFCTSKVHLYAFMSLLLCIRWLLRQTWDLPCPQTGPLNIFFLNSRLTKPHSSPCYLRYWCWNIDQQWFEDLCITKVFKNEITIAASNVEVPFSIYIDMNSWRLSWWSTKSTNTQPPQVKLMLTLSIPHGRWDWKQRGTATGKLFLFIGILLSLSFLIFYPIMPILVTKFS